MSGAVTSIASRADKTDVRALMQTIGAAASAAAEQLALADTQSKQRALLVAASTLRAHTASILSANAEDMSDARTAGLSDALLDRLQLDAHRIEAMATGLE